MNFNTELKQRLQEVKQKLEYYRELTFEKWGKYLFASDIDHSRQLTDTQIAFLTLLSEKYQDEIYPKFQKRLNECFFYYYEEELQEINIKIQGINISNIDTEEWAIHYEDDTVNPLVIIDIKRWDFNDITLVG